RQVGIAHTEVDDVLAGPAAARLHGVHFGKHVGRQALQPVEFGIVHCRFPGGSQVRGGVAGCCCPAGAGAGWAGWAGCSGATGAVVTRAEAPEGAAGAAGLVPAAGGPALPGSAAAGLGGPPVTILPPGLLAGVSCCSLALASRSSASRFSRASRSLASRSAASFSAVSFCAFWPPLP